MKQKYEWVELWMTQSPVVSESVKRSANSYIYNNAQKQILNIFLSLKLYRISQYFSTKFPGIFHYLENNV